MLDWSNCSAVERVPGKVSGAWLFKGTRVPVAALFENLEGGALLPQFAVLQLCADGEKFMKRTIVWCHKSNFNNSVGGTPAEAGETPALLVHENYATKFNDATIVWFV